jgi:hypothetical protein
MALHEVRIDITLAELAATMDAALGRETGMAHMLRRWVIAHDISTHLDIGSNWLRSRPYADRLGKNVIPRRERATDYYGTDTVEPTSVSGVVKKYDPVGWEASRDAYVRARLGGPRTRALPDDIPGDRRTKPVTLARRLSAARVANRAVLKGLRDELVALMDEAGWDEVTRVTSDGYRIGRDTNTVFSLRRYRELYPTDADRPEALRQSTGEVFSCVTPVRGR